MRPQKQKYRHNPELGEFGDCHRTAIACLLDLDRDDVPNFGEHYDDAAAFRAAERRFLAQHGLFTVDTVFACSLDDLLTTQEAVNPGVYYLLAGESASRLCHSVIGCGGAIAWDPSLDDAGIVGPCADGYFWVTHLVPMFMRKQPPGPAGLAPPDMGYESARPEAQSGEWE